MTLEGDITGKGEEEEEEESGLKQGLRARGRRKMRSVGKKGIEREGKNG